MIIKTYLILMVFKRAAHKYYRNPWHLGMCTTMTATLLNNIIKKNEFS